MERKFKKIIYPDLNALGCPDLQIRQIACQLILSSADPGQGTLDLLYHPSFIQLSYIPKLFEISLFTTITFIC